MTEKKAKEEGKERRALAPWRPFEELEAWPGFGEWPFSGRFPRRLEEIFQPGPSGRGRGWLPALDVDENAQHYAITVELPGVGKDDLHVELHEGVLTVRGEKSSEREEKKEHCRYTERSYGSFSRSLRLPTDADPDRLEAAFEDGVLSVTIPKTEEAKPRTIAIKAP